MQILSGVVEPVEDPGQPLSHVSRPTPPWREPEETECGRPLAEVEQWVTRDQAGALIRKYGSQRAAFLLCMTCVNTANRHPRWEISPMGVLARKPAGRGGYKVSDLEMRAVAMLVEQHRAEFDQLLAALQGTTSLAGRRRRQPPPQPTVVWRP